MQESPGEDHSLNDSTSVSLQKAPCQFLPSVSCTQSICRSSFAAAAKSLQSCPTLCSPIDGSPPGSTVPGILQARTLEWVAISFSNAWKWKVKVKSLSHVRLTEAALGLFSWTYTPSLKCRVFMWLTFALPVRISMYHSQKVFGMQCSLKPAHVQSASSHILSMWSFVSCWGVSLCPRLLADMVTWRLPTEV